MSHVQESLYEYQNDKFFNHLGKQAEKINEDIEDIKKANKDKEKGNEKGKEKGKDDKKGGDPEKAKLAKAQEKEIQSVLKKVEDNWKKFQTSAKGNIAAYKAFFDILKECPQKLGSYNPKACYKLFNAIKKGKEGGVVVVPSNYVVISSIIKGKPCLLVVNRNPDETAKDKNEEIVFVSKSPKAAKALEKIVKVIKSQFGAAKEEYKNTVLKQKKEEETKVKQEKLGKFLKEERLTGSEARSLRDNPIGMSDDIINAFSAERDEITPEQYVNFAKDVVILPPVQAVRLLKKIFRKHPIMHSQLGEQPGRDKFIEGQNIISNWWNENEEDWSDEQLHDIQLGGL